MVSLRSMVIYCFLLECVRKNVLSCQFTYIFLADVLFVLFVCMQDCSFFVALVSRIGRSSGRSCS
jgi:hypothetical protein